MVFVVVLTKLNIVTEIRTPVLKCQSSEVEQIESPRIRKEICFRIWDMAEPIRDVSLF